MRKLRNTTTHKNKICIHLSK